MRITRLKSLVRSWLPPVFCNYLRRIDGCSYNGDYASWEEAEHLSGGYDAANILTKVKDALLQVKTGKAVYERDSVLFDKIHYSWPLLSGLLWVLSRCGNRLSIVDFGGSLGSTYFQNKAFLGHISSLQWGVVEQPQFVSCGKDIFEDGHLKFFESIDEAIKNMRPDAVLLSGVLPYVPKPYELLDELLIKGFEYIVIDRTPLLMSEPDRLTVQKVPPVIYDASYPAWILNRPKLLEHMSRDYDLIAEFDALAGEISLGSAKAYDKGFIFRRRR